MTPRSDRVRPRPSTRKLLKTLVAAGLAAGCGEDRLLVPPPAPPQNGSLLISAITTGGAPDADGYRLVVDQGPPSALTASGSLTLTVTSGSHIIELTDVAPHCVVSGGNPRIVGVITGGQSAVTFQIFCPLFGAISVATETSGPSPDPDGYLLNLDGKLRGPIGVEEEQRIEELQPGTYRVRLSSVAGNCNVADGASRQVTLAEGATLNLVFAVACVPRTDDTPGEKIVLSQRTAQDEDHNLYMMNADGSGSQRLTDNVGDEFSPEISADGTRILFLQMSVTGRSLRVIDRASRQESVLPTAGVDRAVWSPGAQDIAFVRNGRIFRMKADGTGESALTGGPDDRDPYWSPDGTRIAFTRGSSVYLMNSDGSSPQLLSSSPAAAGPWSPDGSRMVITRLVENCSWYYCYYYEPGWIPSDLAVLDVESREVTALTQTPADGEWSPVWTPDGQQVLFLYGPGGNPDVYSIRLDGTGLVNLTHSTASEQWVSVGLVGAVTSPLRAAARPR